MIGALIRPNSRSIRAWASDPSMSSAKSRRSTAKLLVYSSTRAGGARPQPSLPHLGGGVPGRLRGAIALAPAISAA